MPIPFGESGAISAECTSMPSSGATRQEARTTASAGTTVRRPTFTAMIRAFAKATARDGLCRIRKQEVEAAYTWFLDGAGERPKPDLLECALLRWEQASDENRLKMIDALADAGRNVCLRRAAMLPEADQMRETVVRRLCDFPGSGGYAPREKPRSLRLSQLVQEQ